MDESANRVETQEPHPGWIRCEVEGCKPFYKSPFPRTVIRSAAMLRDFLQKEHEVGRLIDIDERDFSFKRRLGIKNKSSGQPGVPHLSETGDANAVLDNVVGSTSSSAGSYEKRSVVDLLTRDPNQILDHRKLLSSMSKQVDASRPNNVYQTPPNFDLLREKLYQAADLRDIIAVMSDDKKVNESLAAMFSDMCLAEVSQIDTHKGPMVEFPASVNENVYCFSPVLAQLSPK